MKDEVRFTIGAKFHQTLPSLSSIPPFSPTNFNEWKDKLRSWMRSCHSLDYLIRDVRESYPVRVDDEDLDQFNRRVDIFKARDRACYLVLDKSLSTSVKLDPKYLALSEKMSQDVSTESGQQLFDGIVFLLKGSHLWARIDSLVSMSHFKLDNIGSEQSIYNNWKRESDLQNSLHLDVFMIQKLWLINALSTKKEHKTVMLQLAAMSPEELLNLTPQAILERFIASAGHLKSKDGWHY